MLWMGWWWVVDRVVMVMVMMVGCEWSGGSEWVMAPGEKVSDDQNTIGGIEVCFCTPSVPLVLRRLLTV